MSFNFMLNLIQVGSLLAVSAVCGLLAYRLGVALYI